MDGDMRGATNGPWPCPWHLLWVCQWVGTRSVTMREYPRIALRLAREGEVFCNAHGPDGNIHAECFMNGSQCQQWYHFSF